MSGSTKPRIFFASSSEAIHELEALSLHVTAGNWATIKLWPAQFALGASFLQSLLRSAEDTDFAVLLYSADDRVLSRGVQYDIARDNIVLELGLFLGTLGPDRTVVVTPNDGDLKIPSDYQGYRAASYEKSASAPSEYMARTGLEIKKHFENLWTHLSEATTPPDEEATRYQHADLNADSSGPDLVPVYRDFLHVPDWYQEFERAMDPRRPFRSLDPSMLYYGPGFAANWININEGWEVYRQMQSKLENNVGPPLLHVLDGDSINLVDLGVGDFQMASHVLNLLLYDRPSRELNYIAIDISSDMLFYALNLSQTGERWAPLRELRRKGWAVRGVNTDFHHLEHCRSLFASGRTVFLLLGNTLGNVLSEVTTLRRIGNAMASGDLMLVEVAVEEEEPFSESDLTAQIQDSRSFWAGPFLSFGCPPDAVQLRVSEVHGGMSKGNFAGVAYEVRCDFSRETVLVNPRFREGRIAVAPGSVTMFLVRKYRSDSVGDALQQAGFQVLERSVTPTRSPKERRSCCVLAEKRA